MEGSPTALWLKSLASRCFCQGRWSSCRVVHVAASRLLTLCLYPPWLLLASGFQTMITGLKYAASYAGGPSHLSQAAQRDTTVFEICAGENKQFRDDRIVRWALDMPCRKPWELSLRPRAHAKPMSTRRPRETSVEDMTDQEIRAQRGIYTGITICSSRRRQVGGDANRRTLDLIPISEDTEAKVAAVHDDKDRTRYMRQGACAAGDARFRQSDWSGEDRRKAR